MAKASRLASPNQLISSTQRNSLIAHLRIRGEDLPKEVLVNCHHIEGAIRYAKRKFKHFDSRNPWIFQDSLQRRVYILVDPDWKTLQEKTGARSRSR